MRRRRGWLALIALGLMPTACETATFETDTACLSFNIIRPSRSDTAETLRQVAEHNAAWRAVCSAA